MLYSSAEYVDDDDYDIDAFYTLWALEVDISPVPVIEILLTSFQGYPRPHCENSTGS